MHVSKKLQSASLVHQLRQHAFPPAPVSMQLRSAAQFAGVEHDP